MGGHSVVDFMLKDFGRDKMTQLLEVFAWGPSGGCPAARLRLWLGRIG
jgi:hypothetical protein